MQGKNVQTIEVVKKNVLQINYSKTETELKIDNLNEPSDRDNFAKLPIKHETDNN